MDDLFWTCCDGEVFIRFPLLGLIHLPQSWEHAHVSLMLPTLCCLFVTLTVLASLAVALIPRRFVQSKVPCYAATPVVAYLGLVLIFATSLGDPFIESFVQNASLGASVMEESIPTLQRWKEDPSTSPIALLGSRPRGNFTVWSEEEADRIAERVVTLRETRWTFAEGGSGGSPLLVLGAKYTGSVQGGEFRENIGRLAFDLWDIFGKEFEDLRAFVETTMQAPAHLVRKMWPPAIIVHLPTLLSTRDVAQNIHDDALIPSWAQQIVRKSAKAVLRGPAFCEWQNQTTVLVNLRVPKEGAAVYYWALQNASDSWKDLHRFTIQHNPGKAVFIECQRPHQIVPFTVVESRIERMCIHAFMIPCRHPDHLQNGRHWQVLGPIGR